MKHLILCLVLLASLSSGPATAGNAPDVPPSDVAYSGRLRIEYEGAMFGSGIRNEDWTIHHDHGNEHREAMVDGRKLEVIYRGDTKKSYAVLPGQGIMEMTDSQKFGLAWGIYQGLDPRRTRLPPLGRETISGLETTRYSTTGTDKDGQPITITYWFADKGFPVKIDYQGTAKGQPVAVRLELKDIKLGPQDPSLFEVPAGRILNKAGASSQETAQRQAELQKRAMEIQNMPPGPERDRAMEQLKQEMQAHARQQMEQLMQNMTPEQRAKLEAQQAGQKK